MSNIEWTDVTWNPVTGCDRISPGCDHCYALTMAKRLNAMGNPKYQTDGRPPTSGPGFGVACHPDELDKPAGWGGHKMVFVNSMSDLFHARVPTGFIRDVFTVMEATPQHNYQVLTKRGPRLARLADMLPWPANVWMGVSVESADQLHRVDSLRQVPAAVRFVSAEPLLGPLTLADWTGVHWVIVGGESGPRARRMELRWARDIITSAGGDGAAVFVKQLGSAMARDRGWPGKGNDWAHWPPDLRVRNYPARHPAGVRS